MVVIRFHHTTKRPIVNSIKSIMKPTVVAYGLATKLKGVILDVEDNPEGPNLVMLKEFFRAC